MSPSQQSLYGYIIGKAKNGALWVMRRPTDRVSPSGKSTTQKRRGKSDTFLHKLWVKTRKQYFPNRPDLDDYVVAWSTRSQLRTLASCSMERRRVVVARELNTPQLFKWLEPLLYHEMCHAYLGMDVSKSKGKFQWHGKEFKALERRHPMIKAFDHWVREGGWHSAIRSDRAKRSHAARRSTKEDTSLTMVSS